MTSQSPTPDKLSAWARPIAAIALVFGVMTLFSGGSVLFGPPEARVWAGNYIGFVVWFNFLAGGAYVVAAVGLWQGRRWAVWLAALIAAATALVALGFAIVVLRGAAFEMRTVGALTFRTAFWTAIALIAARWSRRA